MNSGIALLFVAGPLIVVPLLLRVLPTLHAPAADRAVRSASRVALPAGVLLASSFLVSPGPFAASLAIPWLGLGVLTAAAGGVAAVVGLRDGTFWRPGPGHALLVALVFLPVAGANAVADRLGVQPFGFSPTIVLLTAVHFTFAGFALLVIGVVTYARIPRRWLEAALGGVVVGVPITAVGFFGIPVASWLGALLVAGGGLGIGVGLVRAAGLGQTPWSRRLTLVAGVSLLISMPLAIVYATGTWLGASWLDITAMASLHGTLNVAGFAVPAAIALTEEARITRPVTPAVVASPPSAGRRWAIGLITGLVMGVGLLIGGPLVGVLGVVAVVALAATPPHLAGMAGFWLGFGVGWLALFGSAQARCGVDCVAPDPTPWLVTGFVVLAFGAALSFAAGPWRTTRIAGSR